MAVLPDADRRKVWRALMRFWSSQHSQTPGILKEDLYNAVAATDAWIDSKQAEYNQALPEPVKSNLSLTQKTLLFCAVAMMRAGVDILQRLTGEVN